MALHAAVEHGVQVVGVTLSPAQADLARRRVRDAGMEELVEIRVQDYRDVDDGPYEAIASIGMAEHVGRTEFAAYARHLHDLLRPGGRLLNHMIATHEDEHPANPFFEAYVFPDAGLIRLGDTVSALEQGWDEAVAASSEGRARVWRLYMAAAAMGFQQRRLGVNQVLAVRPDGGGISPP